MRVLAVAIDGGSIRLPFAVLAVRESVHELRIVSQVVQRMYVVRTALIRGCQACLSEFRYVELQGSSGVSFFCAFFLAAINFSKEFLSLKSLFAVAFP